MSEYKKQEILPEEIRNSILRNIMMLKSWFDDYMNVQLSWFEYTYIAESLIKQAKVPYSSRDLFDVQLWASKVPVLPGKWYRKECDFDKNIVEFMNSVELNWDYWSTCRNDICRKDML